MKLKLTAAAAALAYLGSTGIAAATVVNPFTIDFTDGTIVSSNTPETGAAASLDFAFSSTTFAGLTGVQLDLTIENTTGDVIFGAGATESTLQSVLFDVTDSLLNDSGNLNVSAVAIPVGFALVSGGSLSGFGGGVSFDLCLTTINNCGQGGQPNGLDEDEMPIVASLFFETSSTADAVAMSLFSAFEDPDDGVDIGLRFQAVNAGAGSDKLIYTGSVSTVPLPATLPLMLGALAAAGLFYRRPLKA